MPLWFSSFTLLQNVKVIEFFPNRILHIFHMFHLGNSLWKTDNFVLIITEQLLLSSLKLLLKADVGSLGILMEFSEN